MEIFIPRDVKDMNDMMKQCKTSYIVSPFMLKSYGIATIEATKILHDNKVDIIFDITGLIAVISKQMNLDIKILKHSPYEDKIINMTTKGFDFYDHIGNLICEVKSEMNQQESNEISDIIQNEKYFYGQEVKVRKRYLPTYIYNDYPSLNDQEYLIGIISYVGKYGCTVIVNGKEASLPNNYIKKADFIAGDKCYIISTDDIFTNQTAIIQSVGANKCLVSLSPYSRSLLTFDKKYLIRLNENFIRRTTHGLQ